MRRILDAATNFGRRHPALGVALADGIYKGLLRFGDVTDAISDRLEAVAGAVTSIRSEAAMPFLRLRVALLKGASPPPQDIWRDSSEVN